jgi:hypothetical protein
MSRKAGRSSGYDDDDYDDGYYDDYYDDDEEEAGATSSAFSSGLFFSDPSLRALLVMKIPHMLRILVDQGILFSTAAAQ